MISGFAAHAYMTRTTSLTNSIHMVGENGINAQLSEPSWNPENAINVLPGDSVKKDPVITNTSEADLDLIVGVEARFVYGKNQQTVNPEDMKKIMEICRIDWNSDLEEGKWIRFEGEEPSDPVQHFYYNEVLKRNYPETGEQTKPLFTRLEFLNEGSSKQFEEIMEAEGFDILLSGYVIQQMDGEENFGLASPRMAYESGLFEFKK